MKRYFTTSLAILGLVAGMGTRQTFAQIRTETFMFVSGIPGSSADANHPGWIDVVSLTQTLEEITKGRAQCSVKVAKFLDIAGPLLWAAAVSGQTFAEINIEVVAASSEIRFYQIRLQNANVTSISTASHGAAFPMENVVVQAPSMTLTFWPLRPDGSLGTPVTSTLACTG